MKQLLIVAFAALALSAFADEPPSRPIARSCAWEKFADESLGLEAWVQRCDFGFRTIDSLTQGRSLAERYSDGDGPQPVIDVIDLEKGETAEAAVKRTFAAKTEKAVAARCEMQPFEGRDPAERKGVKRYTFVPDSAYRKELERTANPDEVPEPPCGEFGEAPDGIQYFEVHDGARRVLFVRFGQDMPMFDADSLKIR